MLVFRNRDLSLFVSTNTTLLELQTLVFIFFQNLRFQIGDAAYLRMPLLHEGLRYPISSQAIQSQWDELE